MGSLENHVKSDTVKWILTLIGFILVGVMLTGIICGWFDEKDPATEKEKTVETGGLVVDPETDEDAPVSLSVMRIASADYGEYGIMPIADSAYKVTAKVKEKESNTYPDYLQEVTWTMAWKTTNSAAVTTFVTMAEDGASATFTCLKAFSTQIVVTCTSVIDDTKSATLTLDYAKRLKTIAYEIFDQSGTVNIGGTKTVSVEFPATYTYGMSGFPTNDEFLGTHLNWYKATYTYDTAGTVENVVNSVSVTVSTSSALRSAYSTATANGKNLSVLSSITIPPTAASAGGWCVRDFYNLLVGKAYNSGDFYYDAVGRNMTEALGKTTNQFTVQLTASMKYGGTVTASYTLNVSIPSTVSALELDHSSYVF